MPNDYDDWECATGGPDPLYSDEHIRQQMDSRHDQSAFKDKKIYESPDGGKTVYSRNFGSNHRRELTGGEKVFGYHPQELLTNKILPIDVFYKLFGQSK